MTVYYYFLVKKLIIIFKIFYIILSLNIEWNDTIKKEARRINNEDLGGGQEVTDGYILVQRGVIKKSFTFQDQAESYDGSVLRLSFRG